MQVLRAGAECSPAGGASCLSAEYAWQQLMPDCAALLRNLCLALEAWPQEMPMPVLFEPPADVHQLALRLRYSVHPMLSAALHTQQMLSQCLPWQVVHAQEQPITSGPQCANLSL